MKYVYTEDFTYKWKSISPAVQTDHKTNINKNGNKIFRKKIFQLSLIISIKYVHWVYLLKQLLIKMEIKFFEKNIPTFINYFINYFY